MDADDNASFIDRKSKKAIKISYQPDDSYDCAFWNSDFDIDKKIDVLNIIFKDYEKAKTGKKQISNLRIIYVLW